MWELQAALSNNPRQWENCYIIHLGSRKFNKKGKACFPNHWDLLLIASRMASFASASVPRAEQRNVLPTPHFCRGGSSHAAYIGSHFSVAECTLIQKITLISRILFTKDSDIFFWINFFCLQFIQNTCVCLRNGISLSKKSPGNQPHLWQLCFLFI